MKKNFFVFLLFFGPAAFSQKKDLRSVLDNKAREIEHKMISWRRDIHEHPELSNMENRTAELVANHLRSLGLEVQTGVAKTGVVGLLKGDRRGPVIALRADMDGLPIKENTGLAFASKEVSTFNGKEVNVMHACGHDSHVAILMAVAEILSSVKSELKGSVKFIFQPAEEGAPEGEEGGAELMVKEGVMENPKVDVIFGLHIRSNLAVGKIAYKPGGTMAAVNDMKIVVKGKPAHGAYPWLAVDPIVVSAQIINNLQTVVSRNLNVTENAGVVTIGAINGGNRGNIIPREVEMLGTVRSLSVEDEKMMLERVRTIITKTAEAAGATVDLKLPYTSHYPVTYNDPGLSASMRPSLIKSAGAGNVIATPAVTGAEDFSFFEQEVPGIFFFLGGMPKRNDEAKAPPHHTAEFFIDESGFQLGVKALANLTADYMNMN